MKIKQFFHRSLAVVLSTALSFGLASQVQAKADSLRIGYQKNGPLLLLKNSGDLDKRLAQQGVEVKWTEFTAGPPLLEALNVESIDFGTTGGTPPIFAQAAKTDLVYVAYDLPAPSSEAIIVPKDSPARTVTDLKGKKVAFNKGSSAHYLVIKSLEEAGLKYDDIEPVFLSPSDARAAFERGSIDAWAIWDPFFAVAEEQLQPRILRNGVDQYSFYLSSRNYVTENPDIIEIVIDELNKVGKWIEANPEQASKEFNKFLGLSYEISHKTVTRRNYGTQFLTDEIVATQQKIADVFTDLELIPVKVNIKDVVWTPAK
ncbi:sulfonate ABC transporter substrate-binding protein [Lonepinella koalarum]|uniref:sulfonate ABC transporter substrate-binding protein n=1 Tax=Lonepinella koalarum TaxID=53417 RepID=UPI003F6DDFD9